MEGGVQVRRSPHPSVKSPEGELERLLLSLHRLSNALGESGVLAKNTIGVSEWAVLSVLDGGEPLHLKQIVRQTGVSRQRIRKVLQELEEKKLVTVGQIPDGDRRQRVVAGTSEGARVRQAILADLRVLAENLATSPVNDIPRRLIQHFRMASQLADRIVRILKPAQKKAEEFWTVSETHACTARVIG